MQSNQSTSVTDTKPGILQRIKDGVFSVATSVGGFLGRITASIKNAALWTIGKAVDVCYYATKIPVIGRYLTWLPASAIGVGFITATLVTVEAFEIGFLTTVSLVVASAGPLGWAMLLSTFELAALMTLVDYTIRALSWLVLPRVMEAVAPEA